MRTPPAQFRFQAVSMELAVQLDTQRVDMLIVTSDGTTIAVECRGDTILDVQRHIGLVVAQCPEIALWKQPQDAGGK